MDPPNVPSGVVQAAWYSLTIAGQIALTFLIIVFAAKGPRVRHLSAILGVLLFAFFTAVVYSILFYTGTYMDPVIPEDTCTAMAVLKHGVEPASLSSILLLLAEALVQFRIRTGKKTFMTSLRFLRLSRVHIPWINMIVWTLVTTFSYLTNKKVVTVRAINTFYCSPTNTNVNKIQSIELIGLSFAMAILIVISVITFFRDWGTICALLNARETDLDGYQDARLLVHAFGVSVMIVGSLLFLAGTQRKTVVAAVILSGVPLFTAIILGARPDIWPAAFPMDLSRLLPKSPSPHIDPFFPTNANPTLQMSSQPVTSIRSASRLDADLPPLPATKEHPPPPTEIIYRYSLTIPSDQAPPRYSVEERRLQILDGAPEMGLMVQSGRLEAGLGQVQCT